MSIYEYLVFDISIMDGELGLAAKLNHRGKEGWQLVSAIILPPLYFGTNNSGVTIRAILMRPKKIE